MLIAIVIIVIIVLVAYHLVKSKPKSLLPGQSLKDGSIVFLGTADSIEAARSMAGAVEGAKSVVYYGPDAGEYAKMVYAVKRASVVLPPGDKYVISPLVRKEGFDSKISMRMGSNDAGETFRNDNTKGTFDAYVQNRLATEHLASSRVPSANTAAGTIWDGYMKRSWEPLASSRIPESNTAAGTIWDGYMKPTWQ